MCIFPVKTECCFKGNKVNWIYILPKLFQLNMRSNIPVSLYLSRVGCIMCLPLFWLRIWGCKEQNITQVRLNKNVISPNANRIVFYTFSGQSDSVQFSHSVVSNSLWSHGLPPCPSPTPRIYLNSCPLNPWCHPTISSNHLILCHPHLLWHCTGDRDQDHPHGKETQKSKMAVWGGLTKRCEKKRSKKQRIKGKI